ncbi:MAG TPA: hypothetical protein VI076_04840 [Actinopolymorphaceae bacterium]
MRVLLGLFLIVHGWIHYGVWLSRQESMAFDPGRSWLLSRRGVSDGVQRNLAIAVAMLVGVVFAIAGIALLAGWGFWRPTTIIGAVVSLALVVTYFSPWLSLALVIDVAMIVALVWAAWPPVSQVGS